MYVLIVGAGQVGESIAQRLQSDHDVVVVDKDPDRIETIQSRYDVLAVTGDGTEPATLREAGIEEASMLLASTDGDETNIVACSTAKAISDVYTVSRIKSNTYYETWQEGRRVFGIDHMVCTNLVTAQEIVQLTQIPGAHDFETFANGLVEMAEFSIDEDSPIANESVETADRFDSLTFAAIIENGTVEIPRGDTVIPPGVRVVVIGSPTSVRSFGQTLHGGDAHDIEDVVVIGETEVGYHVARLFADSGVATRYLVEPADIARTYAEALPAVRVINTDATDVGFLESEHVGDADLLVSALADEADNLLECMIGSDLGIDRTIATVEHPKFIDLFERLGIDIALSPRETVAEEIARYTEDWHSEKVALVGGDLAEIVEIEIGEDSALANRTIREGLAAMETDVVIGAIARNDEFVIPRGETTIEPGDHVIIFVETDGVQEATETL